MPAKCDTISGPCACGAWHGPHEGAPKLPPVSLLYEWSDGYGAPSIQDGYDLARAYLTLWEAARPFAVCRAQVGPYGRVHPCNDCAGCRLARLIGGDE